VVLVEQRAQLGGRAGQIEAEGYVFDTGPTLITAPSLLHELWASAGRDLQDDMSLLPLSPYYSIAFASGRTFAYGGSPAQVEAEIERFAPGESSGYRHLLAATGAIYEQAFVRLGRQPFLSIRDFLRVAPQLLRYGAARSVWGYVGAFIRDPELRIAFSFHPLFIGGNPFRASAIYSIIPYLEATEGVWYTPGGMHALVDAMGRLFERLGGEIRLGDGVEQILLATPSSANGSRSGGRSARSRPRLSGVRLRSGAELTASAVVSNADPFSTYRDLLPENAPLGRSRRRLQRARYSMSCFLLYLGLDRTYPHLAHHTVVMPENFRRTVREVFRGAALPRDLAAYVHAPTRTDPSLAPSGGEVLYVLAPVPNLTTAIDWHREGDAFRDHVLQFVARRLSLDDLERHIVVERRFTPLDFRDTLSSPHGAAFSIEPILAQSASFRPGNRAPDVDGLYFVGAGTHPGAGLPGVLISAEITAALVAGDWRPSRPRGGSPDVRGARA
jgi:phytoene desaturase